MQAAPLHRGQGVPGSVELIECLLDWRDMLRTWVAQTDDPRELAVLIIELEAQLGFDLEFLVEAKKKVRDLSD